MSADTPEASPAPTPDPALAVTRHARQRWLKRIGQPEGDLESVIRSAWMDSIPVGLQSTTETVRLHPPTEALLVVKRDAPVPVLVTVLNLWIAERSGDLNDDHLQQCADCGRRVDPTGPADCPWCGREEVESR